jgi:hypothetical protein
MKTCILSFFALAAFAADPAIDPNLYLGDVKYLSSPEMRGRATGSPELEKAASYIAGKFREFGLKGPKGNGYYQPFQATTSTKLGKANRFRVVENGKPVTLDPHSEFIPLNFSSAAKLAGPIVFAGYGITAAQQKYDDYADLNVKGKIVLILQHEPQEADANSVFAGNRLTSHAAFTSKASNAKMHGAAGVIMIADTPNHRDKPEELQKFGTANGPNDAGIPYVQVKSTRVANWFTAAGKTIDQLAADIDRDLKPRSFAFPETISVDATIDVVREVKTVRNVAAYVPGETDEYIIVGAHYDHLGLGDQHSLAPSMAGTVHHGADDNASGTAGVIELARWFSKQPKQKRGILFLTFAGEEIGLLGSAWYAEHPEIPIEKAVAMLNMDMIGRIRDSKVFIGGTSTGSTFRKMLDQLTPERGLKVDYAEGPEAGSSDHTSFIGKRVPSLFFFSGLHTDYHKPTDTWEKIDAAGAAKLLGLVASVVENLRSDAARPEFIRVAPTGHGSGTGGPVTSSSGTGYGPWFGSVPDFAEGIKGVKFADVSPGSPAAKAGFRGGDIMVEFGGKPIENLYDFTYALREKKPGDEVMVKILRDGKPIEQKVLLTSRQ